MRVLTVTETSIMSSPRRRGSRNGLKEWIPAFAGMTKKKTEVTKEENGSDKEENGSDKKKGSDKRRKRE